MVLASVPAALALFVLAGVVSAVLTWLALRYARSRQLLDQPGHRRSHSLPTPRGGGVGIVLTLLLALPWLHWQEPLQPWALALALLLVAGIGWSDDHHPQPAWRRLAVHGVAASILLLVLVWSDARTQSVPIGWMLLASGVLLFWLVGCINAWNFMDGSNGLLASQCLWLGLMLAAIFHWGAGAAVTASWLIWSLLLAGACAGFLPFNFPRARIFLGDVGSGALGLVCGVLLLVAVGLEPRRFWLLLILPSALLVDAGMTLLSRIVAGRRWYTAHREHLYQWLIRTGRSHARVAAIYMGWNFLVVLPVAVLMEAWPEQAMILSLFTLGLAMVTWWFGKRQLHAGWRRRRVQHWASKVESSQ